MDFACLIWASVFLLPLCAGQNTASVTVPFEVKIVPSTANQLMNVDTMRAFSCSVTKADGSDQNPTLKWYIDDKEVTATSNSDRIYVMSSRSKLMLRFSNVIDEDRGILKCEASLGGQTASKSVSVSTYQRMKVTSKEEQFGILNNQGSIQCEVTGNPTPVMTWMFKNGTPIASNDKYVIKSKEIIVKSLTFEDTGVYVADLFQESGDSMVFEIDFKVVEPPTIPLLPTIQPNNPKVGDEVKITCSAKGHPKPTYQFKRGDQPLTGSEEIKVDTVNGILTLTSVTRNSEGTYICIASNAGGSIESLTDLNVLIPPTIKDLQDVSAVENEERDVTCMAEGDPAPTVTWSKVGEATPYTDANTDPEIVNLPSSDAVDAEIKTAGKTMRFSSVKPSNAGTYICKAISSVGAVNKTVKFEVKYKPHFDTDFKQTEFYGWKGHRANLTCLASANELATFKWYIPSTEAPQDVSKAKQIFSEGNEEPYSVETLQRFPEYHLSSSSLRVFISGDDSTVYRDYLCEADNGQTTVHTVTLKEATPAAQPNLEEIETGSTMAKLEVTKPTDNGGQPVKSYKYTYYDINDTGNKESGVIEEDDIQGEATQFLVSNLKPSTTYSIEISAVNVVGTGSPAIRQIITKEVSKPSPIDITSPYMGTEPTSYFLTWRQPDDGGAPITKFTVTYQKVKVKNPSASPEVWELLEDFDEEPTEHVIENQPDARNFKISALKSSSFYDIRISAENSIGTSEIMHKIIKTSVGAGSLRDSSPCQLGCNLATLLVLLATACVATRVRC